MNRQYVSSSNLRSVGYEPVQAVLEIEFHQGGLYRYFGVPRHVYGALMGASSKGTFFQDHIKDRFQYSKIW